jgi:hypothetical protein
MNEQRVRDEVERLGPWFHNIHLSDTIQTFPTQIVWKDKDVGRMTGIEPNKPGLLARGRGD